MIAVPTAFVRDVIEHLFRGCGEPRHAEPERDQGARREEGEEGRHDRRVHGRRRIDPRRRQASAGKPGIAFGGDSVSLSLPVSVAKGTGKATIHFVWDGKNVAGLTCGDLDVAQKVTGTVIPGSYVVAGVLSLSHRGRQDGRDAPLPRDQVGLRVKPSQESWDAIHALLDEKRGVCGWVLDKVDVPHLLTNLTEEKGFSVKLPLDKIRPVVLPAGIQDSVAVGERTLAIAAQTNTIRIDPDAMWFSARVRLETAD